MRSFARAVEVFRRYRGYPAGDPIAAQMVGEAAADIQNLFSKRNWRFFEKQVDTELWGTETVTVQSVSGGLVTISQDVKSRWVGQDIAFASGQPYRIIRTNATKSFVIEPDFVGAVPAAGSSATVRQSRVGLPANFAALLSVVLRDNFESRWVAPAQIMDHMMRTGSVTGPYADVHTVQNKNLVLWPPRKGRLVFRFRYRPDNLYVYDVGRAIVKTDDLQYAIGSLGTQWKLLPDNGVGSVLEEKINVSTGMPYSAPIVGVDTDTRLVLGEDWKGTKTTAFAYQISTDLDLPPYMDQWVETQARRRVNKATERDVVVAFYNAAAADDASAEVPSVGTSWWPANVQPRPTVWLD